MEGIDWGRVIGKGLGAGGLVLIISDFLIPCSNRMAHLPED